MAYSIQEMDATAFIKVRGSTDAQQMFLTWRGSIYSFVPDEPQKHLFNIVGMSVGRFIDNQDGSWDLTSRELSYYLDPITDHPLRTWENPWTGERLTVVHVANKLVQRFIQGRLPVGVNGDTTTVFFNLFSNYPNPLKDEKFLAYSPNPHYQSVELFKFTAATDELLDPEKSSASQVMLSWDRVGPWLPWMKMGNKAGHLIYSAFGNKADSFSALPELLQDEINSRLPLYKNAPTSKLDQEDMTSWIYFKRYFEAYLRGDVFPIPESEDE
ncbi:DUF1838 domain-containing protein [Allocoleopsis franciscana]|uniref:DUF1838 domain-containing protein n=1 Tax=Allocoleopsis franciscana PCC 7113 TaxID=1173027 RepID=K9WMM4_9CYAN|nr:DUF1838 domain-containing protein [Allocoleopsis franciscana]AFZ21645.1 Protein of unknown function (DUF1838) [Allocoleopsis franciscana PCC 7113]